ncbi:hypothetical protein OS493_033204 [Desmophyllum pertusum]|uniref:Uncharacterized protein n=1 Tax=Desmophyllum pertusum TaxID=174260 RepID=A0A9X0CCJ5_9CNID|nr:hypothetical protein OS493_033204 [Desmophyllum pertusum]
MVELKTFELYKLDYNLGEEFVYNDDEKNSRKMEQNDNYISARRRLVQEREQYLNDVKNIVDKRRDLLSGEILELRRKVNKLNSRNQKRSYIRGAKNHVQDIKDLYDNYDKLVQMRIELLETRVLELIRNLSITETG